MDDTIDFPLLDDQIGPGYPVQEPEEQKKLITVAMPKHPNAPGGPKDAPKIEVVITAGKNLSIDAKVTGKVTCEEEYNAIMTLLERMV